MFTAVIGEGLTIPTSAELFVKQRLQMVDARKRFRESHDEGARNSMDELGEYLEQAKNYVSDAKESAKEYICNAKDYFYSNMQTDSIIQTTNKAQSEAEYPAYGLTGPSTQVASNMTNGDRKLAQSAQMYHYQHQKQQMIAMEKREKGEVQGNAESDYDSEEENEDGDLTVYECPGLAPEFAGIVKTSSWLLVHALFMLGWLPIEIQTTNKAQSEAEYPAYGLTGPSTQVASNMTNGDRKLAQSAQMYHYQHQKQQMIAMEKREKGEVQGNAESDYDSEEENEDGDLTVYECPGLAPTGEMQVKNPLFTEDHRSEASSQPEEKQ